MDEPAIEPCYGLGINTASQSPRLNYRADIDGMRAVAILLVLAFHFDLFALGAVGFTGVDVFFVISGFLITAVLLGQLRAGTFRLRDFYAARIRRLAPALFAVLTLVMVAGAVWLFPRELADLAKQALASQLYVSNVYFWLNTNYFGLGVNEVYLLHTWSLAVEEQFYLLYPVSLLLLYRYLPRNFMWWAILAGALASFALNLLFVSTKPQATFYLLPTRAWELGIGALTLCISTKWVRGRALDEVLGFVGALLLVGAFIWYRSDIRFPGFFALLPTGAAACWLLAGQNSSTLTARTLGWRPLVYVGRISYSLYLIHWPVSVFAQNLLRDYGWGWRLAMCALSVALAAAMYHLIEEPVRRRQVLRADTQLLLRYAAGVLTTILIASVILLARGLPQRFPDRVARLAAFVDDKSPPLTQCEFPAGSLQLSDLCRIGDRGRAPAWFVYGDSHAWAAHAAFDRWLIEQGQAGIFMYRHACPPLIGVHLVGEQDQCFAFNETVIRILRANPSLTNVALVSTWRQAIEGRLSSSASALLTPAESVQLFTRQFAQTVALLKTLGRAVYIWEPLPGAKGSVPLGLARAALEHRAADLETDRSQYEKDYGFFFDALETNCDSVIASFSPAAALCDTGKCAVAYEGRPLYADNGHMTASTTDFWVQILRHPLACRRAR
jgi:peptidoglycan/LPS O-acetylase OafA/YrhL